MIRLTRSLFVGLAFGICQLVQAAPATLVKTITHQSETVTLRLTRENLRGANFELLAHNAAGTYDPITPVAERSYIGTVDEYPGAVSYGILEDSGIFKGGIIFDRGFDWYIRDNAVTSTSSVDQPASFGYTPATVSPGQGGSRVYGFDVGIDARFEYFNERGGANIAKTFEIIEYSLAQNRALYLHDAMLRPFLARVVIRTDAAKDPAKGLTGGTYLDALRTEWLNNHASASRDVVAGVATSHVWAGLAWVNVIASNNAFSVNDSQGDGNFNQVWRHELGHNWGLSHYDGGAPEAGTINSNNHFSRMSGPELQKVFNQRDAKLWALDDLGPMNTVNIPPYAAYDSATFTQLAQSTITIDVLANDHDANGHALTLAWVDGTTVQGGTVTIQGQKAVYKPSGDFLGVDSFTYTVQDSSGQTATGAVAVQVGVEYPEPALAIANFSFESGPSTGVPPNWNLTAGSSSSIGTGAGGSEGSRFLWIGPGNELTQDLGHLLADGEKLTLKYESSRTHARTIQFLAKSGGTYQLMGETSEAIGWSSWGTATFIHHVLPAFAGQELAIRIISGGWNEFDNFRVSSVSGASRPVPFDGATEVKPGKLSWQANPSATSHQVYLGTNKTAVTNATTASSEYRGSTSGTSFSIVTNPETTYYWRVDSLVGAGVEKGVVWTFVRNHVVGIPIANSSFETGPATGIPADWTLTAGSSSTLGCGAGGSDGSQFLWIGPNTQITQDLVYTLTAGETITLKYDSSRTHTRNIQLLAKSGGSYQLLAETTERIGWSSWGTAQLSHTVGASYAGQQLAIRIISHNWNEFDNFRLTSILPQIVFSDNFETAAAWSSNWPSKGAWNRVTARKYDGGYSAEIDGNVVDSALVSKTIDVTGKSSVTISFAWYIENGLDAGEYLAFDTNTGTGWTQGAIRRGNVDPEDVWATESIVLDVSTTNSLTIRFRGKMSLASEDAYVDQVTVLAQ